MIFLCSVMSSSSMSITNATLNCWWEILSIVQMKIDFFSFLFAFCSVSLRLLIIISNSSSQKRIIKLVNSTPLSQLGPWFTFHIFNIFLLFISTRYRTIVVRRQSEKNPPLRAQGPCSVKCNFSHECRLTSYVIRDECGIFLNGFMKLS